MHKIRFLLSGAVLAISLSVSDARAAELDVIGSATQLKPEAGARLQGKARDLAVGAELHRDEQVWTARGGRVDIKFVDGSSVTLGENARLVLDEFVLPADGGTGSQVLRSITGALRFVGGAVDQAGSTKIVTPIATMIIFFLPFIAASLLPDCCRAAGRFRLGGCVRARLLSCSGRSAARPRRRSLRAASPPLRGRS